MYVIVLSICTFNFVCIVILAVVMAAAVFPADVQAMVAAAEGVVFKNYKMYLLLLQLQSDLL